jgi:hypothetical protein
MSLTTTTNTFSITGNGVTTTLPVPVYFLADSDWKVYKVTIADGTRVLQTLNTDYTVTGALNPAGGTIELTVAPSSSYKIVAYRDPPLTQAVVTVQDDPFPVKSHLEKPLDKLTMIAQRLAERLDRVVYLPDGQDPTPNLAIPDISTRSGKVLGFENSATAPLTVMTPTTSTIVAASETAAGIAELATQTETNTGTDDTRIVTPLKLATYITTLPGAKLLQRTYATYATNADLTTTIPFDDTIPQSTEGTEIITQAITPLSASSRIRIRFQAFGGTNAVSAFAAALFKDSDADAICVSAAYVGDANNAEAIVLEYEEASGSTSSRTYKIRVGGATGATLRLNGTTSGRLFGGRAIATLIVEEIA